MFCCNQCWRTHVLCIRSCQYRQWTGISSKWRTKKGTWYHFILSAFISLRECTKTDVDNCNWSRGTGKSMLLNAITKTFEWRWVGHQLAKQQCQVWQQWLLEVQHYIGGGNSCHENTERQQVDRLQKYLKGDEGKTSKEHWTDRMAYYRSQVYVKTRNSKTDSTVPFGGMNVILHISSLQQQMQMVHFIHYHILSKMNP